MIFQSMEPQEAQVVTQNSNKNNSGGADPAPVHHDDFTCVLTATSSAAQARTAGPRRTARSGLQSMMTFWGNTEYVLLEGGEGDH